MSHTLLRRARAGVLCSLLFGVLGAACNCGGEGELGRLVARVDAVPNPLDFGTVYVGLTASRTLTVRSVGTIPLEVGSVIVEPGSSAGLEVDPVRFELAPAGTRELVVRLEARELGPISGAIIIRSNDETKPALRVPIAATGARRVGPALALCVESADLGVARRCALPLSVDFGVRALGSATRARVVLRSVGDQPVRVTSAAPTAASAPSFRFDPPALAETLPVDAERAVEVVLEPAAEGPLQAVYQVVSDDPERDLVPVIFTASGVRSALCAAPSSLDFGTAPIGQGVTRSVTLSNCGQTELDLTAVGVEGGAGELAVAPLAAPVHLAVGAEHAVEVTYTPRDMGVDMARLRATSTGGDAYVALRGQTAVCDVVVTPSAVGFGAVGVGQSRTRTVLIENVGAAPCTLSNVALGGSSEFELAPPPAVPAALPSGASLTVSVRYAPGDAGADTGVLAVVSDDPAEPRIDVALDGRRLEAGECLLTATPDPIDFGVVAVGTRAAMQVQITNAGSTSCTVLEVKLGGASSPYLSAAGAPMVPLLLPGRSFTTNVHFQPLQTGPVAGALEVRTRLTTPPLAFPITGAGAGARLCVSPSPVVFGSHPQGSSIDRAVTLTSCGSQPLVVGALSLPAPTSSEYLLPSPPATPLTLAPGTSATLDVRYVGASPGRDDGVLRIASNDGVEPVLDVPLVAATGAQCGDLTARVCGLDGVGPVPGATVYVDTAGVRVQTTTDANGDFVLTCLPVGGVTVTVESGSWSTSFTAQVQDQTLTSVPGQHCLDVRSARVAVVWGRWDNIEGILDVLGVPYTFYDEMQQTDLLLDPAEMARYDVIFLNCGSNDLVVSSGPGAQYLTDWVSNGGSLYASDWAYDAIEQNWPMFIDFVGNDVVTDAAESAGNYSGLADVVEPTLRTALSGRSSVPISSCCTAMDSAAPPTTTYLRGDRLNDGGVHPLFVSFQPTATSGVVMYTDFHNSGQGDIDTIFRWLLNRL